LASLLAPLLHLVPLLFEPCALLGREHGQELLPACLAAGAQLFVQGLRPGLLLGRKRLALSAQPTQLAQLGALVLVGPARVLPEGAQLLPLRVRQVELATQAAQVHTVSAGHALADTAAAPAHALAAPPDAVLRHARRRGSVLLSEGEGGRARDEAGRQNDVGKSASLGH
jgi:hypothetical protein